MGSIKYGMGYVMNHMSKFEEAIQLLTECLECVLMVYSSDHPEVLKVYAELGYSFEKVGNFF